MVIQKSLFGFVLPRPVKEGFDKHDESVYASSATFVIAQTTDLFFSMSVEVENVHAVTIPTQKKRKYEEQIINFMEKNEFRRSSVKQTKC